MDKRQLLIDLYERNMKLVCSFRDDYKKYLDNTNRWNEPAFSDSHLTHKQYYNEFIKTTDIEYSELQHNAIKTADIQESFLDQYIAGVNQQFNNLSLIYEDLKQKSTSIQ